jgi:hypothetical protein
MGTIDQLTWDSLYNWAMRQQIVGATNSSHYCPIARFLDEVTENRWTVDDGQAAKLNDVHCYENETNSLPQWAKIVADAVDALNGDRVTRAQFLAIMDEVQPEV